MMKQKTSVLPEWQENLVVTSHHRESHAERGLSKKQDTPCAAQTEVSSNSNTSSHFSSGCNALPHKTRFNPIWLNLLLQGSLHEPGRWKWLGTRRAVLVVGTPWFTWALGQGLVVPPRKLPEFMSFSSLMILMMVDGDHPFDSPAAVAASQLKPGPANREVGVQCVHCTCAVSPACPLASSHPLSLL